MKSDEGKRLLTDWRRSGPAGQSCSGRWLSVSRRTRFQPAIKNNREIHSLLLCPFQMRRLWRRRQGICKVGKKTTKRLYLKLPGVRSFERVPISRGEGQHTSLSSSVVGFGDGVKLLLTCRVPQHQPHFLSIQPENHKSTSKKITTFPFLLLFLLSPSKFVFWILIIDGLYARKVLEVHHPILCRWFWRAARRGKNRGLYFYAHYAVIVELVVAKSKTDRLFYLYNILSAWDIFGASFQWMDRQNHRFTFPGKSLTFGNER